MFCFCSCIVPRMSFKIKMEQMITSWFILYNIWVKQCISLSWWWFYWLWKAEIYKQSQLQPSSSESPALIQMQTSTPPIPTWWGLTGGASSIRKQERDFVLDGQSAERWTVWTLPSRSTRSCSSLRLDCVGGARTDRFVSMRFTHQHKTWTPSTVSQHIKHAYTHTHTLKLMCLRGSLECSFLRGQTIVSRKLFHVSINYMKESGVSILTRWRAGLNEEGGGD